MASKATEYQRVAALSKAWSRKASKIVFRHLSVGARYALKNKKFLRKARCERNNHSRKINGFHKIKYAGNGRQRKPVVASTDRASDQYSTNVRRLLQGAVYT